MIPIPDDAITELERAGFAVERVGLAMLVTESDAGRWLVAPGIFDPEPGLCEVFLHLDADPPAAPVGQPILLWRGSFWRAVGTAAEPWDGRAIAAALRPPHNPTPDETTEVAVLAEPGDADRPLAVWLSAGGSPLRPIAFLGDERKTTVTRASIEDGDGTPLTGPIRFSAHDIGAGGSAVWVGWLHQEVSRNADRTDA